MWIVEFLFSKLELWNIFKIIEAISIFKLQLSILIKNEIFFL